MVKAIVEIDEEANKVINVLRAQYDLKDKSQAINEMAKQYKELLLDSGVRPEYLKRLEKIRKEPILRKHGRPKGIAIRWKQ
jgi:Tat protein secretion system quality control protein TatD with DNase activity